MREALLQSLGRHRRGPGTGSERTCTPASESCGLTSLCFWKSGLESVGSGPILGTEAPSQVPERTKRPEARIN